MNKLLFMVAAILAILLIACSGEKKAESQMEMKPEAKTAVAVEEGKATCPSCSMVMDKSEMLTHVAEGDTIYFCAEGCKKHYLAQQDNKVQE